MDNKKSYKKYKDFVEFSITDDGNYLKSFLIDYTNAKTKGAVKETPPTKLNGVKLDKWLDEKMNKYYSTKKMKIPSGLKKGSDYDEVYNKNGTQVFAIYTYEGSRLLGAGCNWCIKRENSYWREYTSPAGYNFAFYFVRTHSIPNSNSNYKIAVAVDTSHYLDSVYDSNDVENASSTRAVVNALPKSIFKWFEVETYSKEDMKHFNKLFKAWIKDLDKEKDEYQYKRKEWAKTHVAWKEIENEGKGIEKKMNVLRGEIKELKGNIKIKSKQKNENLQLNIYSLEENKEQLKQKEDELEELNNSEAYEMYMNYKDNPIEYFEENDDIEIRDDFEWNYFQGWSISNYGIPDELVEFYNETKAFNDLGSDITEYINDYIVGNDFGDLVKNLEPDNVLDYYESY